MVDAAGAPDGDVHLGRRGGQRVADDLDLDGVQFGHDLALQRCQRWPYGPRYGPDSPIRMVV